MKISIPDYISTKSIAFDDGLTLVVRYNPEKEEAEGDTNDLKTFSEIAVDVISDRKISESQSLGFDFKGTLCSASDDDLTMVVNTDYLYNASGDDYLSEMVFSNGSVLEVDKNNFDLFKKDWVKFRVETTTKKDE